ncbi:MAG TPA: anti-sigma factor [Gemmatimonadales bacterium]|nr:anti-sigma factor [Gemmatimonadales bacterium]
MRHIPEEELHAYLDQALSRSQCVEIESHLAGCDACREARDGIAALRDRTTALLATLAPPRRIPPAFDTLRARHAERQALRRHRLQLAAWAASLVAALGLGWGLSILQQHEAAARRAPLAAGVRERPAVATQPPAPLGHPLGVPAGSPAVAQRPAAAPVRPAPALPAAHAARPAAPDESLRPGALEEREERNHVSGGDRSSEGRRPAALQISSSRLPEDGDLQMNGMWQTLPFEGARDSDGQLPPRIEGLPVMQVQVQRGDAGQRPLMVVAQQLQSGEVIRTIEGPAADVSSLLGRSSGGAPSPWPTLQDDANASSIQGRDGAMAMRVGDRILAITAPLPSDSLLAMIRRLNAEIRSGSPAPVAPLPKKK